MGKIFDAVLGFIQNQKKASFLILAVLIGLALVYFIFKGIITAVIAALGWLGLVLGVIWAVLIVWALIKKKLSPAD